MGGQITLHDGDNRISLRRLIDQGVRVHSVVTDPPYALTSITKRFGRQGAAAARSEGNDGSFSRLSGGFMGHGWDATGIERDPEFWKLVYDILLPGGCVFAFSGARTGHWQACAMEIAGFIMHPMHGWTYGSGFPKGHNPALPGWEGWKHGTQTQKPALEPIYLGQKPYDSKTCRENLIKHGVGAFNIDGCKVGDGSESRSRDGELAMDRRYIDDGSTNFAALPGSARGGSPAGRYPSNLILDGSPEVVALFPQGKSGKPGTMRKGKNDGACYGAESRAPGTPMSGYGDEGSNARFFHQFAPTAEDYQWAIDTGVISEDRGDAIVYNAKANKADRAGSKHPTVKPITLMQYLIRHITPPGGTVLDMFAGTGTTAEAARREGFDCILMEAEPSYLEFLNSRFHFASETRIGEHSYLGEASKIEAPSPYDNDLCLIDILSDRIVVSDELRTTEVVGSGRSVAGNDLTDLLSL
ncbi:site-specific DNA-methyltransferase [Mesorhizobium sp. INR15]|uniref:site-specific DNA-methyltransferase n=1 Tax=Mesorhizobium sp. INR15 TaxID=2654248 RepID=UPI0018965410|nr:site-specific DNA-methyltransferase [Mesorhizobium sp. INR15]QPC91468.1 site-specific DNA-methyltransferase [Mesorhizobium sp. INR15]